MLSGTVAVTDDSLYIDENFTDQELCTYSLEKLEELPELIKSLLEDKEWAEKLQKREKACTGGIVLAGFNKRYGTLS